MAQSYNFFGMGPGQQAPGQDPATLAAQMALQQFNNPTSSSAQSSSSPSIPSIDPKMLAKLMMQNSTPSQQSMGVGSGLTPQFAQGLTDPNASGATGSSLTQQFGNGLMSMPPQSPYNINGAWNG